MTERTPLVRFIAGRADMILQSALLSHYQPRRWYFFARPPCREAHVSWSSLARLISSYTEYSLAQQLCRKPPTIRRQWHLPSWPSSLPAKVQVLADCRSRCTTSKSTTQVETPVAPTTRKSIQVTAVVEANASPSELQPECAR